MKKSFLLKQNNKKIFILLFLAIITVLLFSLFCTNQVAEAATIKQTVYTNNCPGFTDYKHILTTNTNIRQRYMNKNLTGWVGKDINTMTLTYSRAVSGTASYQTTGSLGVDAKLISKVLGVSASIEKSRAYSYTASFMSKYKYTVRPDEPGNYFCIAINYDTVQTKIDHYKQEFKWFGQGNYNYESSSTVRTPSEQYIAKNYRYDMFGSIYESKKA